MAAATRTATGASTAATTTPIAPPATAGPRRLQLRAAKRLPQRLQRPLWLLQRQVGGLTPPLLPADRHKWCLYPALPDCSSSSPPHTSPSYTAAGMFLISVIVGGVFSIHLIISFHLLSPVSTPLLKSVPPLLLLALHLATHGFVAVGLATFADAVWLFLCRCFHSPWCFIMVSCDIVSELGLCQPLPQSQMRFAPCSPSTPLL